VADLFESLRLGGTVSLKNRIVMAPMTRTRTSEGDVPNMLMATYYGQRSTAGLIVAEATDVAPSSKGYALTPGIHTEDQKRDWRLVTDEVHRKKGTIFLQLWHVGRMAHPSLMPDGEDGGKGRVGSFCPRRARQVGIHARGYTQAASNGGSIGLGRDLLAGLR